MGGCSTHNGCSQSVGWAGDYDAWAAAGLTGWSASEFGVHLDSAAQRMRIRRYRDEEIQPFQLAFMAASAVAGLPRAADLDDLEGRAGVDVTPVNIVDGIRWNASFGYLDPVRHNGFLTVCASTRAVRIVLRGPRAVGVEVLRDGRVHQIACDHVVVASGTYGTPELLLRSGVGPAADLSALGITVNADLPGVGRNLHDHPSVTLEFDATSELVTRLDSFRSATGWLPEEQCVAKARSSVADGPYDLHFYPWVEPRADSPYGWIVVLPAALLTPRSRGSVTLDPQDPMGASVLDHRFLSHPDDVVALADGLALLSELADGAELSPLLGRRRNPREDGEDTDSFIRRTHSHYWHPAGTAAMGLDPARAVTGPTGSVHGIDGLTVADASLFPSVPRATPALPVVALGELIAAAMP